MKAKANTSAKSTASGGRCTVTTSARERAAAEEAARWRYYRSIPQKHWLEMSGRPWKTIKKQAALYGIPFGNATICLPDVAHGLHDFLAAHHDVFACARGANGDGSLALRLLRARTVETEAKAERQRMKADAERGRVVAHGDHVAVLETLVKAFAESIRGLAAEFGALVPEHERDFTARAERRLAEMANRIEGKSSGGPADDKAAPGAADGEKQGGAERTARGRRGAGPERGRSGD